MPIPIASPEDLEALLRKARFRLTSEQVAEYVEAYGYIAAMAERIRDDRSYMVEPAHVFAQPREVQS